MPDDSIAGQSQEQRLASVLSEATDAICRGEMIDIEMLCRDNADIADELKRLLGAVLVTDTAGAVQDEGLADSSRLSPRWRSLKLPTTVGDYELIEELGRGGMGVVFRARQISLNREVAVKMILRGRLASDADLERFLAEASATAKLEHSNIVPVYDVGDVDGRPFFSMQLVEGETLTDAVSNGPLPQRRAAEIVAKIARAIAFAHREGILHRDLKPGNIMIADDGTPMITDFGLAKQASSEENLTRSGMLLGTPAYMSPEQAGGRRALVGPLSDVYSLGCVLYFALTGRSPFVAESPMEVIMLVIEQDPSPPRALRPSLDRDLEMIVIRCLQKADGSALRIGGRTGRRPRSLLSGRESVRSQWSFQPSDRQTVSAKRIMPRFLENWGLLWMWHSLVVLVASLLTWQMDQFGVTQRWIYAAVWTIGLGAWAGVFWKLRQRMGPVTFIERANCARVGSQLNCDRIAVSAGRLAGHESAQLVADAGRDQRDGVHRQSGHVDRRVLHSSDGSVGGFVRDGSLAKSSAPDFWCDRCRVFLPARLQVCAAIEARPVSEPPIKLDAKPAATIPVGS